MFGRPLYRPPLPPERAARLQAQLDSATAEFRIRPEDPAALLWVGRRLAYLGHYREAIAAYTRGIGLHPADARFFRHRGHRYITCRQFDLAIADLRHAALLVAGEADEIEPDGQPNAAGIPLGTLHGNIHYHLALAHYLRQEFVPAVDAWLRARALARNDDMVVATSYWLYLSYRRLGREAQAASVLSDIRPDMRIIENHAYHDLLRLFGGELAAEALLEKGRAGGQFSTYGYGVASWYLLSGDRVRGEALLREIVNENDWAAFGYIAAETELERIERAR
jgi:tetratricopeptide (TPR) repeat protein